MLRSVSRYYRAQGCCRPASHHSASPTTPVQCSHTATYYHCSMSSERVLVEPSATSSQTLSRLARAAYYASQRLQQLQWSLPAAAFPSRVCDGPLDVSMLMGQNGSAVPAQARWGPRSITDYIERSCLSNCDMRRACWFWLSLHLAAS